MKPAGNPFAASVWERLTAPATAAMLTLEQHKRAITRDLEDLLNTRTATADADLDGLPLSRRSIANFGLADFAQLCLSSSADRKDICDQLEAAIARHENLGFCMATCRNMPRSTWPRQHALAWRMPPAMPK